MPRFPACCPAPKARRGWDQAGAWRRPAGQGALTELGPTVSAHRQDAVTAANQTRAGRPAEGAPRQGGVEHANPATRSSAELAAHPKPGH